MFVFMIDCIETDMFVLSTYEGEWPNDKFKELNESSYEYGEMDNEDERIKIEPVL